MDVKTYSLGETVPTPPLEKQNKGVFEEKDPNQISKDLNGPLPTLADRLAEQRDNPPKPGTPK